MRTLKKNELMLRNSYIDNQTLKTVDIIRKEGENVFGRTLDHEGRVVEVIIEDYFLREKDDF